MARGILSAIAAGAMLLPAALGQTCNYPNGQFQPVMAAGWTSQLIANGLRNPRDIAFDTEGNLLVTEAGGVGVTQFKLQQDGDRVCVQSSKNVVSYGQLNHALAVSDDGKTLFVSSSTTVFSYDYDAAAGTASNQKTIITNMQQGGYHQSRTLLVPKNDPTKLLVSRGSDGNIDGPTSQITSGRSQLRVFDIAAIQANAIPYTSGEVLGWGLRNSVGIAENPVTGGIWSVENSVDDMRRGGQDIHNENPAEELNFHGNIQEGADNTLMGANYGYPDCYTAWDPSIIPADVQIGQQFMIDSPSGGSTDDACLNQMEAPKIAFPSHTAPLDVIFTEDGKSAYVSFHGSWNRNPPDGYRVGKIDFGEDGQPLQTAAESKNAVEYVMANQNLGGCPNSCFRPCGLAIDDQGRIFMSSDQSGELYVIYPPA